MDAPPPIPELERLVMEEIWEQGEATVRSVRTALNAGADQPERAYTTVLTIMQRLDAKRLVVRSRDGKTDVYRAALPREEYLGARADAEVSELLEQYGELALVQFARRMAALDPQRLAALRELAGERPLGVAEGQR
jgi:predicted transcriptional regulator